MTITALSGQELDERHRQELLSSGRFEVTTLHSGGQDKGHVLVVDDLAVDFMFPADSAKQELALIDLSGDSGQASRTFIGLHPVHSDDQMCLDIQSLINLYPFFQPEQLLVWAEMESALFLDGIRSGRLERMLNRLNDVMVSLPDDAKALAGDALRDADPDALADGRDGWHVGEYIASGGRLMWFAGLVKAVARQHLSRLGSRASKLRLPVPGGRYYLFPAAVGRRQVPAGHVELDPARATAWVNDADWLETIVDVLGGCDGDDAVWVFPFSDLGDGRLAKLLLWRSPNQVGEYVLLRPTAASQPIAWETVAAPLVFPALDSRRLPPRIDMVAHQYGTLTAVGNGRDNGTAYTVAAMDAAIHQAAANQGVLGSHCNALMVCKAVYGRLPDSLPATLEAVIDGSVKSGLDLTPVKQWNSMALRRMARHGLVNPRRRLPETLLDRLPDWLRPTACDARQPASADSQPVDTGLPPVHTGLPPVHTGLPPVYTGLPPVYTGFPPVHWLDVLSAAIDRHKAQYWAEAEALAAEACPPLALFEQGRDWLHLGKELRQVYSQVIRQALAAAAADKELPEAVYDEAREASEAYLALWPVAQRPFILLGAAAYLYVQGPEGGAPVRDGVLWQLGARRGVGNGRLPGIAQAMMAALRQIGLLDEPAWPTTGAAWATVGTSRCDHDEPPGVPVRINGTWLNLLNARRSEPYVRMSDVPPAEREQAKTRVAAYAATKFQGMALTTAVTDDNRVITRTPRGNLFGYVQRDHELAAIRHDQWRIAWATAVDGNVLAVLVPIADCGLRIAE